MPNISETIRETVTKLSGFLEVILCEIWRGSDSPILGEEVVKLKLSPLISPKWEVRGLKILNAVGGL